MHSVELAPFAVTLIAFPEVEAPVETFTSSVEQSATMEDAKLLAAAIDVDTTTFDVAEYDVGVKTVAAPKKHSATTRGIATRSFKRFFAVIKRAFPVIMLLPTFFYILALVKGETVATQTRAALTHANVSTVHAASENPRRKTKYTSTAVPAPRIKATSSYCTRPGKASAPR